MAVETGGWTPTFQGDLGGVWQALVQGVQGDSPGSSKLAAWRFWGHPADPSCSRVTLVNRGEMAGAAMVFTVTEGAVYGGGSQPLSIFKSMGRVAQR